MNTNAIAGHAMGAESWYMQRAESGFRPIGILWPAIAVMLLGFGVRPTAVLAATASDDVALEEIVVTAEKFKSTVQNTPISMSALSAAQLSAAGITSVEELTRDIPGISMRSAGPGETEYEARGLASNGGAAPTVGFYLDEVPLSPPALAQTGKVVIDPDLYDVSRIEVLRGPQGTLYGSGSMGGTVKLVTNQPKLGVVEGSVQGTLSQTHSGGTNGSASGMVNLPIGDKASIRIVGTDIYRSGWIDRIVLNPFPVGENTRGDVTSAPVQSVAKDVNTEHLYGGRISALVQASDTLSITAMAFYQRLVLGGFDQFDNPPGPGYMAHFQPFALAEPLADEVHIYSLTVQATLPFADFTSASAYWDRIESVTGDGSESGTLSVNSFPSMSGAVLPGYVSIPYNETDGTHQFSQEFRFSSRDEGRIHWIAGAFYSDLHSSWKQYSANPAFTALSLPASDNPLGIIFASDNPYRIRQYALFADGSIKFTDAWKFSTGLRWYRYLSDQLTNEWGEFSASLTPSPVPQRTTASDKGFNPRFDLSYAPSGQLTTYLSASKGFRPGGANIQVPSFCGQSPTSFGPDSAWNYEVGEKAKLLGNRVTVNSDFYYIRWTAVQEALILPCGYQYNSNAGNGRSYGPELEITAKVFDDWIVAASGAYTDAKITQPSAALATYLAGSTSSCPTAMDCTVPILNVPKYTASLSVAYAIPQLADYGVNVRLSGSTVGPAIDESYNFGIDLPSYTLVNARVSMSKANWSANAFINNVTNRIAWLGANNTSFQFNNPGFYRVSTNQPRTLGVQLSYKF